MPQGSTNGLCTTWPHAQTTRVYHGYRWCCIYSFQQTPWLDITLHSDKLSAKLKLNSCIHYHIFIKIYRKINRTQNFTINNFSLIWLMAQRSLTNFTSIPRSITSSSRLYFTAIWWHQRWLRNSTLSNPNPWIIFVSDLCLLSAGNLPHKSFAKFYDYWQSVAADFCQLRRQIKA